MERNGYPIIKFSSRKALEEWLQKQYASVNGIWIQFAKKGTGVTTVTYAEAVEVALCYGWIDGLTNKLDETYWIVKFTPRGAKSIWSKRNRDIVQRLISEGKMKAPGLEKVDAAKKDGRWDQAYDSPKNMVVPQDFIDAVAKDPESLAFYKTLNKSNTYAIAFRLQTAKKPETRERRMKVLLEMISKKQKIY